MDVTKVRREGSHEVTDEERNETVYCERQKPMHTVKRHYRVKEHAKFILWVISDQAESWPKWSNAALLHIIFQNTFFCFLNPIAVLDKP